MPWLINDTITSYQPAPNLATSATSSVPGFFIAQEPTTATTIRTKLTKHRFKAATVFTDHFSRLSYVNSMGHVDVADQLRNTYRFDHWLRNRKWWWSFFFWAIGVILVNSYVLYIKVQLKAGRKRRDCLSHHDFNRSVLLSWIKGDEMKGTPTIRKRKMLLKVWRRDQPKRQSVQGWRFLMIQLSNLVAHCTNVLTQPWITFLKWQSPMPGALCIDGQPILRRQSRCFIVPRATLLFVQRATGCYM